MSVAGQIAIYGGSFNPPHVGHQMACLYLLEALGAEAVWLVPAWKHPFGKELAPYEHRLEMCARMAAALGARVRVSDVERELGGEGLTYDTLVYLRQRNPEVKLALAVGADILAETEQWHRWDDIVAMVPLAVMGRGGHVAPPEYGRLLDMPEVSSTEVRALLRAGESARGLIPGRVADYIEEHGLYRRA